MTYEQLKWVAAMGLTLLVIIGNGLVVQDIEIKPAGALGLIIANVSMMFVGVLVAST